MKNWFLLVVAIVCVSCSQSSYEIQGTYTTADGTEIYLINIETKDTLSVTTVKDGKFSFTGQLSQPFYAYVGQGKVRVHLVLEPGTVLVDLDERTVAGTPMIDAYMAFHRNFYGYDSQRNKERQALTDIKETISTDEFNEQWNLINDKYRVLQATLTDSLVSRNTNNLLGALALDDLAYRDTAKFMQLYRGMSPEMQAFTLLQKDVKTIEHQGKTAPGKLFTDYLIKHGNLDGSDVSLSDYVGKGKYILLDHWASWCGPCKMEMPYIKKTWEAFAGEHFDVVSVAVNDKREDTLNSLKTMDMPWHQIIDAQNIPSEIYSFGTIPHIILFAPDGTILKRGIREEQIYSTIKQLMEELNS